MKNIEALDSYCNNVVRESNTFTQAIFDLSVNAIKFLQLIISMMSVNDHDNRTYYFRIRDLKALFGLKSSGAGYVEIPLATKELMSKVVIIPISEKKFRQYPLLSMAEHDVGTGIVGARIHPDLKPFFENLKDDDTQYRYLYLARLKSYFSIQLYRLMKNGPDDKVVSYPLEFLRKYFAIETPAYDRIDNIRNRVLDVAIKEITEKTDISITYETLKEGRKCVGITFYVESKAIDQLEIDQTKEQYEVLRQIDEIINLFKEATDNADINASNVKDLIDLKGYEVVKQYAKDINEYVYEGVNSVQALFMDAVKKHGTPKQYVKPQKPKVTGAIIPQHTNFTQRKYTDEEFEAVYSN